MTLSNEIGVLSAGCEQQERLTITFDLASCTGFTPESLESSCEAQSLNSNRNCQTRPNAINTSAEFDRASLVQITLAS